MSKLATKIAKAPAPSRSDLQRGPVAACASIYGPSDMDDWEAVEALRRDGLTWRETQRHIDGILGVSKPITGDKFRYHWRRRCFCWKPEDRL